MKKTIGINEFPAFIEEFRPPLSVLIGQNAIPDYRHLFAKFLTLPPLTRTLYRRRDTDAYLLSICAPRCRGQRQYDRAGRRQAIVRRSQGLHGHDSEFVEVAIAGSLGDRYAAIRRERVDSGVLVLRQQGKMNIRL